MSCSAHCPERTSQDSDISPAPIEDQEIICRAAYSTNHGTYPRINNGFLRKADFINNELSVWRASRKANFNIYQVKERLSLSGPANNRITAVGCVSARRLRNLMVQSGGRRGLCLRDECTIDHLGGKHHAHGHIAPCMMSFPAPIDDTTVDFTQLWSDMRLAFKNNMHP